MSTAPIFHLTKGSFLSIIPLFSRSLSVAMTATTRQPDSPTDSLASVSAVAPDTRPRYPHNMHLSTANHSFHTLVNIIVTEFQSM